MGVVEGVYGGCGEGLWGFLEVFWEDFGWKKFMGVYGVFMKVYGGFVEDLWKVYEGVMEE